MSEEESGADGAKHHHGKNAALAVPIGKTADKVHAENGAESAGEINVRQLGFTQTDIQHHVGTDIGNDEKSCESDRADERESTQMAGHSDDPPQMHPE